MAAYEYKCACGMKYGGDRGTVPEVCECGNQIAKARVKGHRVWMESESGLLCPVCREANLTEVAFGNTGGMTMFECPKCNAWGYEMKDLLRQRTEVEESNPDLALRLAEAHWDEIESDARGAATNLGRLLPKPIAPDGLWYRDDAGQQRPTPAQLSRLSQPTVSAYCDFIKTRIGRGHWPADESEGLLNAFQRLLPCGEVNEEAYRQLVRFANRLALAVAAEYLYVAVRHKS